MSSKISGTGISIRQANERDAAAAAAAAGGGGGDRSASHAPPHRLLIYAAVVVALAAVAFGGYSYLKAPPAPKSSRHGKSSSFSSKAPPIDAPPVNASARYRVPLDAAFKFFATPENRIMWHLGCVQVSPPSFFPGASFACATCMRQL